MTYLELINQFWDSYRLKKFPDIDTAFYFFLLNECNIRRWLNPFELQTRHLELSLSVSRKTIVEARNRLKQRGVIDVIEASGRGPSTYLIKGAEITNPDLSKLFCVSSELHKGNTKGNTKVTQRVTQRLHKGNTNAISTLLDKDRRYKIEDIVSPNPLKKNSGDVLDLNFGEKRTEAKKSSPPPAENPTLEDVKSYFLSQNADKRLSDWETDAAIFFTTFDATGWVDAKGRKIRRWDSRANRWIIENEQKQKDERTRTAQKTRYDPRRGIDAGNPGEKDWDAPI